jgi:hypothetical protein
MVKLIKNVYTLYFTVKYKPPWDTPKARCMWSQKFPDYETDKQCSDPFSILYVGKSLLSKF